MPQAATRSRPTPAPQAEDDTANKPVERFHHGSVNVSIWEKTGTKGLFRTASFQLRYRDGEEWRTSNSYGLSDLDNLEKAAREAHERIQKWQQATTPSREPRS